MDRLFFEITMSHLLDLIFKLCYKMLFSLVRSNDLEFFYLLKPHFWQYLGRYLILDIIMMYVDLDHASLIICAQGSPQFLKQL